jgi:hypothetical protein
MIFWILAGIGAFFGYRYLKQRSRAKTYKRK